MRNVAVVSTLDNKHKLTHTLPNQSTTNQMVKSCCCCSSVFLYNENVKKEKKNNDDGDVMLKPQCAILQQPC